MRTAIAGLDGNLSFHQPASLPVRWTLRPARIFSAGGKLGPAQTSPRNGFATTLYCWGYGDSTEAAGVAWDAALRALIESVSTFSPS